MILAYNQVKARPKLLLAMTGLTQGEFDQLLLHFQHAWDQFVRQNYVDRANRQRQYGGGRSEATLVTLEDKLLFILYYMKVYPLQEVLAFEFGMVEFIPIKLWVTRGAGAPGNCAGRNRAPSPDRGRPPSTGGSGLSRCDSA